MKCYPISVYNVCTCPATNGTHTHTCTKTPRIRNHHRREDRKIWRARGHRIRLVQLFSSGHDRTNALQNSQRLWLSAQHQVNQLPTLEWEGSCVHTLNWKVNDSWRLLVESESQFSVKVWQLEDHPSSRRWPQAHHVYGQENWTQWLIKEKKRRHEVWKDIDARVDPEKVRVNLI